MLTSKSESTELRAGGESHQGQQATRNEGRRKARGAHMTSDMISLGKRSKRAIEGFDSSFQDTTCEESEALSVE